MIWIVFAIFLGEIALFVLARVVNRAEAEADVTRRADPMTRAS